MERDIKWLTFQEDFDVYTMEMLSFMAGIDRKAELAQKNEATKLVLAREGDSWETLVVRAGVGLDKVTEVRELNGIRYGERPEPGQSYLVP